MSPLFDELHVFEPWFPFVRVGMLLAFGIALEIFARRLGRRMSQRIDAKLGTARDLERRRRAATLMSFATSVARVIIWVTVLITLLAEVNINVGPLIAGAGVVGAALAFGAQNIVKDYLAGFFILLENQYTLGDVIKIGAVSGTVEDITMRITVLRSADGTTHVLPNGTIQLVSNMTTTWARVIVDVGIAHTARTDDALEAMRDVATSVAADAALKSKLIEIPEVVGVVALQDNSATLRMQVKVVPEEQWTVRTAIVGRLKRALDERHVPFPALPVPPPT